MLYRPLGRTGLSVSEIGLGCASFWGKPAFDERLARELVHVAIEAGVTFFDTGASYSAGQAEPRLGRALEGCAADGLVIATKAGTFAGGGRIGRDFSPAAVVASAETSLRNLRIESLGLLQLHGPDITDITDELRAALSGLKARGLVRALGVNSFDPAVIDHVIGLPEFDAVMIDYNVLRPEREPLMARAVEAGKGVLAGMPLAMGHTAPPVRRLRGPQEIWYLARALVRHRAELTRGARFRFLHDLEGMSGSQAALAYVLARPDVSCAVMGTTRLSHLTENIRASGMGLPAEVMARIRATQALAS